MKILIAPLTGVQTGQYVVTEEVIRCFEPDIRLDVGGVGLTASRKVAKFFVNFLVLASVCMRVKHVVCYASPSRSTLGFWREAPLFLLLLLLDNRLILHLHGLDLAPFYNRSSAFQKWFLRFIYSRAETIVLFGEMASQVNFAVPRNLHVLNNFVSLPESDDVGNCTDTLPDGCSGRMVLWASHIVREKGLDILLDALAHQAFGAESYEIHIAGAVLDDSYFEMMKSHPSWANVIYHGEIDKAAMQCLMNRADIFVFSSRHPTECFPMVLLEAAYSRCHVICSRLNHIPQIFGEFAFSFFDTEDVVGLAYHLTDLDEGLVLTKGALNKERALMFCRRRFRTQLQDILRGSGDQ